MSPQVGVTLSGGGHRAAIWGLGTLLYLVDADRHREVATISSVSGGSITNGVVAHEVDYPNVDARMFDRKVAPLVRHVADTGLFFWGPATNPYVIRLLGLAGMSALLLLAGLGLLAVDGLRLRSGLVLLAAVVLFLVTARTFARRSLVVDRALQRTYFSTNGHATRLADLSRSIDHVVCATELQSGDHLYLSPRFLYSYRFGFGSPSGLLLSTAVQVSACLPGAFAARRLSTVSHRFAGAMGSTPPDMVLTDGGVYDNMADQWVGGLSRRLRRLPELPAMGREVDEVIVVNASSSPGLTTKRLARSVLLTELTTLLRVNSVMYQVTTERRRQSLVTEWDMAARSGEGMCGALVHIAQSPYHVADGYRSSTDWPDRAERAQAVAGALGDDDVSRREWLRHSETSQRVPTVLRRLGRKTTIDLLEHSYVLAMCNLHVVLGYPLLSLPGRDRFARLLE